MQLLIQRNQRNLLLGVVFSLWAKFDLKQEELALIDKYGMRSAIITEGNMWRDLRKAALSSGFFLLVLFLAATVYYNLGILQMLGIFVNLSLEGLRLA